MGMDHLICATEGIRRLSTQPEATQGFQVEANE